MKLVRILGPANSAGISLFGLLVFAYLFLIVDAPFDRFFLHRGDKLRRWSCQSNMRQIYLAIAQYSQDSDGRLPPVIGGKSRYYGVAGWTMTIQPQLKAFNVFCCPADQNWLTREPRKKGFTSYYYNSNLASQKGYELPFPQNTLLIGDGDDGIDISDSKYAMSSFPQRWLDDPNSPAQRHLGCANYVMVDGSLHWLKPTEVTTFGGRKNAFAVK
jgi:hypothetical protein